MKKSLFLLLIFFTAVTTISCGGSSGSSSDDYTDPGFGEVDDTKSGKTFSFSSIGESCSGKSCNAVIFQEEIDGIDYVAIGVNDKHDDDNFNMKIYWQASSIPSTVSLDESNYTININNNTTKTGDLNLSITNNGDDTYTIDFTSNDIVVGGSYTISNSTDSIRAAAY